MYAWTRKCTKPVAVLNISLSCSTSCGLTEFWSVISNNNTSAHCSSRWLSWPHVFMMEKHDLCLQPATIFNLVNTIRCMMEALQCPGEAYFMIKTRYNGTDARIIVLPRQCNRLLSLLLSRMVATKHHLVQNIDNRVHGRVKSWIFCQAKKTCWLFRNRL